MTWEEAVIYARNKSEYKELIDAAYLSSDLKKNVEQYRISREYEEINKYLLGYFHKEEILRILDVGSGNGITAVNFAIDGHKVMALEPDQSNQVGAGAIQSLKNSFGLDNLEIVTSYAEDLDLPNGDFDLVFVRQAMHHANDLQSFIKNTTRFLRKGGILFTVRDHVVFNASDQKQFLKSHPLHKFYGGENAFSREEYKGAMKNAGLDLIQEIDYFASPINLAPNDLNSIHVRISEENSKIKEALVARLGIIGKSAFVFWLYGMFRNNPNDWLDERKIPGRMYSYICKKI